MKNRWPPQWNQKKIGFVFGGILTAAVLVSTLLAYVLTDSVPQKGTWIWDTSTIVTQKDEILSFAKQNGVTDIYLYIDQKNVSPDHYARFIRKAKKTQIRVEALGGDPSWGWKEKRLYLQGFLEWVGSYNTNVQKDEQFSGIHLDIEPYLLPEWKSQKELVLEEWLSNIEFAVKEVRLSSGLKVSADLPFWIHQIKVPGYEDFPVSRWMLKRLDTVVLMDYRDQAEGKDGIVSHALDMVKEASSMDKSVIVGLEMAPTQEGTKTTFYEEGFQVMEQELKKTHEHLKNLSGFKGVAIHGFPNWMASYGKEKSSSKGERP